MACEVTYTVPHNHNQSPMNIQVGNSTYSSGQTVTEKCATNKAANVWSVQVV